MLDYPNKKDYIQIESEGREIQAKYPAVTCGRGGLLLGGDNLVWLHILSKTYRRQIDLVYIDPPYNTNHSFFYAPERTSHISTHEGAQVAYDDNKPFYAYLEFIRERLYIIHDLLSTHGTLYLHIDLKVGHYIKIILDEIFGHENFLNDITRIKSNPKNFSRKAFGNQKDVIYVYSRSYQNNIFNNIPELMDQAELNKKFAHIDSSGRRYTTIPCHAPGETRNGVTGAPWRGIFPPVGRHWRCSPEKLEALDKAGLIEWSANRVPRIKKFADEHQGKKIQDVWTNFKDPPYPIYPTEKNMNMLELIVRQSSNMDSLLLDAFCGSGAFLAAGLKHGRRVIGIDESEIALKVASQREELIQAKMIRL